MKCLVIALIFAVVFTTGSAQAADRKLYLSGHFGMSFTSDLDFPGINVAFSPGFNLGGAVGVDFGQIRAEGEFTYRSADVDTINGLSLPVDIELSSYSFMANGYYDFGEANTVMEPYIGAGLGYVRSDLDTTGFGSASESDLGYQLMLGLGFKISTNEVLTIGYRFFGIADSEAPDTHEFNLGARFMF